MRYTHGRCTKCEKRTGDHTVRVVYRWKPGRIGETLKLAWCPACKGKLHQTATALLIGDVRVYEHRPIFSNWRPL